MAIANEIDLVLAYDGNFRIDSTRILEDVAPHSDEHAAQCVAIETVRGWLASGLTLDEYNAISETDWPVLLRQVTDEAVGRARLNVTAPVGRLTPDQVISAANIGTNFFEHGYNTIMAGIGNLDKISFTKLGGL
jgi:hypothetical protein